MSDEVNPYEPPETEGSPNETPQRSEADPAGNGMQVVLTVIVVVVIFGLVMGLG